MITTLINQINEDFNIDVTGNKRSVGLIFLRHYIINQFIDYKNVHLTVAFNKNTAYIYNAKRYAKQHAKDPRYKEIVEVAESRCIEKYNAFVEKYGKKESGFIYIPKEKPVKLRMLPSLAIVYLRRNRKSELWKKDWKMFSDKDWDELLTY